MTEICRPSSRKARRILVVEDHAESRESLTHFLELKGHAVRAAYDGLEGLNAANEFNPEIVFLNLCMPRMDGIELCARLQAMHQTENAAVIAMTGRVADGIRRSRLRCAFDAFLKKPIEFGVVEILINTVAH